MERIKVKFAKISDGATIPSKTDNNVGMDIYIDKKALDENNGFFVLEPNSTRLIPTGIIGWCEDTHYFNLANRGSNGSNGMLQSCGIIEGEYQGEWFVAMTNTNDRPVIILSDKRMNCPHVLEEVFGEDFDEINPIVYPASKGICQAIVLPKPLLDIDTVDKEVILNMPSIRKDGKLGSSGK